MFQLSGFYCNIETPHTQNYGPLDPHILSSGVPASSGVPRRAGPFLSFFAAHLLFAQPYVGNLE